MFQFEENKTYRMPPFFGGPDFHKTFEVRVENTFLMNYTIKTDGKKLQDYLPEGFELEKQEYNITFLQLGQTDFMFGQGYNIIQIDIPAKFNGKKDHISGKFPLIIWENNTKPIIGGREECGQPKTYADIQDIHIKDGEYFTNASYFGNTFLKLSANNVKPVDQATLQNIKDISKISNIFGWRYIPKVGLPGADISQPILYPQGNEVSGVWIGDANFEWIKLDDRYHYISASTGMIDHPSQYEAIRQLSELPIYEVDPVVLITGTLIMRPNESYVLG